VKRRIVFIAVLAVLMILTTSVVFAAPGKNADKGNLDKGFDEYGYNYSANIFVGTGDSVDRVWGNDTSIWANDRLVMNWNDEWDRGNAGPDGIRHTADDWTDGPYAAWCTNHWNGNVPGGSGETENFKCIWVGPELQDSPYWREGGEPIWGQFEIIFDKYTYADGLVEWLKATPAGLGGILK